MTKTFLNIEEANKEIKRLRKKLCCCPNNCPLSQRTYYGDEMLINDPVQIQLILNGNQIYGLGGVDAAAAIINANAALLGLAVFTFENSKIKMVTSICGDFSLVASIDG